MVNVPHEGNFFYRDVDIPYGFLFRTKKMTTLSKKIHILNFKEELSSPLNPLCTCSFKGVGDSQTP